MERKRGGGGGGKTKVSDNEKSKARKHIENLSLSQGGMDPWGGEETRLLGGSGFQNWPRD